MLHLLHVVLQHVSLLVAEVVVENIRMRYGKNPYITGQCKAFIRHKPIMSQLAASSEFLCVCAHVMPLASPAAL